MIKRKQLGLIVSILCLLFGVCLTFKKQGIDQRSITISTYEKMQEEQQSFTVYVKKSSCPDCKQYDQLLQDARSWSFIWQQNVLYVIDLEQETDTTFVTQFVTENQLTEVPTLVKVTPHGNQLQDITSVF